MTFSVIRHCVTVSKQLLGGVKTVVRGPREIAEGLIDRKVTDGLLDTLVPVLETVVGLSVGVMKLGVTNRAVLSSEIETEMASGSHSVLAPSRDLLFGQ
jgi:hypothetical protein